MAATAVISTLSTEYLYVPIQVNVPPDEFTSAVYMALSKTAVPGTFWAAFYDPVTESIRLLIGPDGVTGILTPGRWFVYVKVEDLPETPVKTALGHINVY